jgi:hypothetical protein
MIPHTILEVLTHWIYLTKGKFQQTSFPLLAYGIFGEFGLQETG